jgi:beta-galactosidase
MSNLKGGIVSYRYGGREMIEWIPRPNFWRAPTDNDYGNKMPARYGQWKLATLYQDFISPDQDPYAEESDARRFPIIKETEDYVDVTFRKYLPTSPKCTCLVTYRVIADGTVRVSMDYEAVKGLSPMPEFGFMFRLNADYDHMTYYGMGPEENYCDRKSGARLGVYERAVKDNVEHYLVPQETGNRTGVRWARITDHQGRGMEFHGAGFVDSKDPFASRPGTMEFSAVPYSPEQLEEALHPYELPRIQYTVVRCSLKQMGVAGDNSWGARTHDEFLVPSDKPLHFAFEFKGI